MNAKEAVQLANDARAAYLDVRSALDRARAERKVAGDAFDALWRLWKTNTSLEVSDGLRAANAAFEAADQRVQNANRDGIDEARNAWSLKVQEATVLVLKEAGLRTPDDEYP